MGESDWRLIAYLRDFARPPRACPVGESDYSLKAPRHVRPRLSGSHGRAVAPNLIHPRGKLVGVLRE